MGMGFFPLYLILTMIPHSKKSSSIRKMWISKDLNLNNARPLVLIQAKSLESMQWRSYVVSKNLLESQGYYQGCSKLWLPKQTPHSLSNPNPSLSLQDYPSKPIKTWKSKTSTSLKKPSYPYDRLHIIKIWIPKRPSDQENKVEVISRSHLQLH